MNSSGAISCRATFKPRSTLRLNWLASVSTQRFERKLRLSLQKLNDKDTIGVAIAQLNEILLQLTPHQFVITIVTNNAVILIGVNF